MLQACTQLAFIHAAQCSRFLLPTGSSKLNQWLNAVTAAAKAQLHTCSGCQVGIAAKWSHNSAALSTSCSSNASKNPPSTSDAAPTAVLPWVSQLAAHTTRLDQVPQYYRAGQHQQRSSHWQHQLLQHASRLWQLQFPGLPPWCSQFTMGQHQQHSNLALSSHYHNLLNQWLYTGPVAAAQYSTTADGSGSSSSSKSGTTKGKLPPSGPSHRTLRALPFTTSREAAREAFTNYHGKSWYQSRQQPVLTKPFKETYLPFWIGSGSLRVVVRGAEVGQEKLVTRYDPQTRRQMHRWETIWSRVRLNLAWDRQLLPEHEDMELYAGWKYNRHDVETLRPGSVVQLARPITPDMLQATQSSGHTTRRVGPFTVEPQAARRLLMARLESAERRAAETEIARTTGGAQVRFVDMECTWFGSAGPAAGGGAGARGGLDLMPVYVPAYVFSWWHGGTKARTFVSGVNPAAVSGAQVLDDTKLATLAAATTAGLGLLLGLSLTWLFWGAFVVPFILAGVVTRFWPLVRHWLLTTAEGLQPKQPGFFASLFGGLFGRKTATEEDTKVDWDVEFVHAYERYEQRQQQREQQQSYRQTAHDGSDAFPDFEEFIQDPFSWFERQFAKQQRGERRQQQQQMGGSSRARAGPGYGGGGGYSRSTAGAAPGYDSRDPKGYYKTLGVNPGASSQEVQAAFRGLALQHHPDKYSTPADKERATKRFQVITEAYQVLRDSKKRQQYDTGLFMG